MKVWETIQMMQMENKTAVLALMRSLMVNLEQTLRGGRNPDYPNEPPDSDEEMGVGSSL
jgi:hypothetical protein